MDDVDLVPEEKECAICDVGLAAVGLVIGIVFLYISIDVLSKGAVTRLLTRGTNV